MRTDAKNGENHPEDQINQNVGQYNPPRMWAAHPISKRAPPLNVVADTNMNTNRTRERCSSTSSQPPACAAQRQQTADGEDLVGTRCHVRRRVTILEVEGFSPPTLPVSCNVYSIPSCTIHRLSIKFTLLNTYRKRLKKVHILLPFL